MSQETLKRLRLLIPGILILLVFPPLFLPTLDASALWKRVSSTKVLFDSFVAVVIGSLYIILNARRVALKSSLASIDNNIKDKLLETCLPDPVISRKVSRLKQGRTLMHVFYRLVDNDPTLQEKAKRVRFNGLLWSTAADLMTVSALGSVAYTIGFMVTDRVHHLLLMLSLMALFVVAKFGLMPIITRKHIDISNEQLEFIRLYFRTNLCNELKRI